MFLWWRNVVSLFPLYCPFNPVAYASSFGWRRHRCQVSGQFISDFSVACATSGGIFFISLPLKKFSQCRLNYPVPCMGIAQYRVYEVEIAITAFNKNLLFLEDGAWRVVGGGVYKTSFLESHMNVGLKSLVAF